MSVPNAREREPTAMTAPLGANLNLLRSPRSRQPLKLVGSALVTAGDVERYPIVDGVPVLIDAEDSIVGGLVEGRRAASPIARPRRRGVAAFVKRLLSPTKRETVENIGLFVEALKQANPAPLVLVIGGGTEGQGTGQLYRDSAIRRLSFDIYRSPGIDMIADAHEIPLADDSVDGVLVQAVLEHVLEPERVVAEIWRVLKPGGIVYAETPFLQQVHEAAYDFTRFTDSGHRYLFRRFALIRSGPSGGAGTQLLWSLDYFFRGLFRSRAVGKAVKLAFFWLRWADRLIPRAQNIDNASGVYLLGRKATTVVTPQEIIAYYSGAQR